MSKFQQHDLALPFGRIRIIRNNRHNGIRLLCLHGWLDNLASFLPMAPLLEQLDWVAVDLAGHGRSAHRDPSSLYHYIDYVRDIKLIIDALGWERCHLLGHSMGGSLSLMAANAFPAHFQSLVMIDSLYPLSRSPEEGPPMLRRAMQQFSRWDPTRTKSFPDIDAAVSARLSASRYPMNPDHARMIMSHATKKDGVQLRLRSDARLNFRSPLMLSRPQVEAFMQTPKLPKLAILATHGILRTHEKLSQSLALLTNLQLETLEGGHHIHMERPGEVAALVETFLVSQQGRQALPGSDGLTEA